MCGLVGIAGDTSGTWKDVFAELLLFDVVRGPHSTGVGLVGRTNDKFELIKRSGGPWNVFDTAEYDKAMNSSQRVIIGHNRFATVGDKTEENAHPFMFKDIIGAHNGTLEKYSLKDLPDYDKYGTDSEAIFAGFQFEGLKDTMKVMNGAWALTWFDKRDNKLHFLRNDKRPLHYAYSHDKTTLIWSSERELLEYVLGRRNKKMLEDRVFVVETDTHYTWDVPVSINKKFDVPVRVEQKGRTWTNVSSYKGPFHSTNGSSGSTTTTTAHHGSKKSAVKFYDAPVPYEHRQDTSKFRHPYRDAHGYQLTKNQFRMVTHNGCSMCGTTDQPWNQFIHMLGNYVGQYTPYMCESCYNDPQLYDYVNYAI